MGLQCQVVRTVVKGLSEEVERGLTPCTGYLDHPFKNWHFEKRLIKEKRGANVELAREALLDEGCCVGARALPNLSARFSRAKKAEPKGSTQRSRGKAFCHLGSGI